MNRMQSSGPGSLLAASDQEGNKLSNSLFQVNQARLVIHKAIHAAREDAQRQRVFARRRGGECAHTACVD